MTTTRPRSLSMGDLIRSPAYRMPDPMQMMYSRRLGNIVAKAAESNRARVDSFLSSLPKLSEKEVAVLGHEDSSCPICLNSFLTILTEEEIALALDTPAHPIEDLGVTKVTGCGHLFCVKDIRSWITQGHNTCPSCRSVLIEPTQAVDESLVNEVSALGRQMHAYAAGGRGPTGNGVVSLTSEQVASLRSAIALLQQGDGVEMLFNLPPPEHPVDHHDHPPASHEHRDVYDLDDSDTFSGMYS